jgi:hypothetical protein
MADEQHDDVEEAKRILREAGFPVENIRILPAAPSGTTDQAAADDGPPIDRPALLDACLETLADGEGHAAKDLARILRGRFPGLTRKQVNSVLSIEGKGRVAYDRENFTYKATAGNE